MPENRERAKEKQIVFSDSAFPHKSLYASMSRNIESPSHDPLQGTHEAVPGLYTFRTDHISSCHQPHVPSPELSTNTTS